MLLGRLVHRPDLPRMRLAQMAAHLSNGPSNGPSTGMTLRNLAKSHTFTAKLPPDPLFPTPLKSHSTPREELGPRQVKGGLYTFVRPEKQDEHELLAVSPMAMQDIGLPQGEESTEEFRQVVAGNLMLGWDEPSGEGTYPWAQCYGGRDVSSRHKHQDTNLRQDGNCMNDLSRELHYIDHL